MARCPQRAVREGMHLSLLARALPILDHWPECAATLPQRHLPFGHVSAPRECRDPPGCSPGPSVPPRSGVGTPRAHPGARGSSSARSGAQQETPAAAEARLSHRALSHSHESDSGVYPWSASPWLRRRLSSSSGCRAAPSDSAAGGGAAGEGALLPLTGVHVFQCEVSLLALRLACIPLPWADRDHCEALCCFPAKQVQCTWARGKQG